MLSLDCATAEARRERLKLLLKKNGLIIRYVKSVDKELLLISIKSGASILFSTEELCKDYDIILASVSMNGYAITYYHVDRKFLSNRDIALVTVKQCGSMLWYFSTAIRNDREVVLEAIKSDGTVLSYTTKFSTDREIVLAAVSHCGTALRWASSDLRSDPEIVLAALRSDGDAIEYVITKPASHCRVTSVLDRKTLLMAISSCSNFITVLNYWPRECLGGDALHPCIDEEVAIALINNNVKALKYIPSHFLENEKVILTAVKKDGMYLRYYRGGCGLEKIVHAALANCGKSIRLLPPNVAPTKKMIILAIESGTFNLYDLPEEYFTNSIITLAILHNSKTLFIALRKSRSFLRIAATYKDYIPKSVAESYAVCGSDASGIMCDHMLRVRKFRKKK